MLDRMSGTGEGVILEELGTDGDVQALVSADEAS